MKSRVVLVSQKTLDALAASSMANGSIGFDMSMIVHAKREGWFWIQLRSSTYNALKQTMLPRETYDDAIQRLLGQ